MLCNKFVPRLEWWSQGHSFCQDTRVLPLRSYDMIIGYDWLEDFSPMWIHWGKRIMLFTHKGRRV
uniref:Uncharacterized protein n=1 Tax=Arundo donax TaxID=35708 RepID=A0A0A9EA72_ARUDO